MNPNEPLIGQKSQTKAVDTWRFRPDFEVFLFWNNLAIFFKFRKKYAQMCRFVKNQPPFCYMRNGGRIMIFAYRLRSPNAVRFTLDTYAFLHQSCLHPTSPSWTPWATPVGLNNLEGGNYLPPQVQNHFLLYHWNTTMDCGQMEDPVNRMLRKHTCEFQAYIWSTRDPKTTLRATPAT